MEVQRIDYGKIDQIQQRKAGVLSMSMNIAEAIRTRGLTLIAYNARWDRDNKIDEIIDEYLKHITDVKPITARQCIKLLPMIAKAKPELRNDICLALQRADISFYEDSMWPLVYKDIQKALKEIQKL